MPAVCVCVSVYDPQMSVSNAREYDLIHIRLCSKELGAARFF